MFVDAGVTIDIAYYRTVLLSQQLLSAICQIYGEYIFSAGHCPGIQGT